MRTNRLCKRCVSLEWHGGESYGDVNQTKIIAQDYASRHASGTQASQLSTQLIAQPPTSRYGIKAVLLLDVLGQVHSYGRTERYSERAIRNVCRMSGALESALPGSMPGEHNGALGTYQIIIRTVTGGSIFVDSLNRCNAHRIGIVLLHTIFLDFLFY
jgi:hypothetical protein